MSGAPKFSYTPGEIRAISATAIRGFEKELAGLLNLSPAQRNFKNTVIAFENARDKLTEAVQIPQFLALVSPDADARKASEELRQTMGKYLVDLMTREEIFDAFKDCAEKGEPLAPVDARLLEKRLRDFKKNGLGLDARKRNTVKKILKELVALNLEFQKNLRDVDDALEVTVKELAGLPEEYKARLKQTKGGGYLVTMNYPDYNPFMENAESADARRRLCAMFNNRCAGANSRLLEKALFLRGKLAKLMGYATYADYVLEERMAKNSGEVFAFLDRLRAKLGKKARMELRARLKLKSNGEKKLKAWETAYYSNQLKKSGYEIDHEKVKEYFPLETVLTGMFDVFSELLDVKFVQVPMPVWHKEVHSYEVREKNGTLAGYFYLDLFPREGKYKHVICSSLRSERELENGAYVLPVAAILANFSGPSGGLPPLLKFNEVHTLFHEFGHVLQMIFSRGKYSRLASINAAWDFVEVPSTTLQQWAYEPSVLQRVSGHYKDATRKLPAETINKLIAARNIDSGLQYLRMIAMSAVDMRYHTARGRVATTKVYERLMKSISLVNIVEGSHPEASFGHLMGGYSAGYYSYIWAEVVAADIFGVFRSSGVMNRDTGRKYRDLILTPGASSAEAERIKIFLGRPFSEEPFLKSIAA